MTTILRAPVSWLTALAALAASPSVQAQPLYQFMPVMPPSQAGAANPPSGLTLNAASQVIAGLPSVGPDSWIIVQPWAVRALAGVRADSMPTEQLQLSRECACNFASGWPAVFLALGFTAFTPGNNSVPQLGC